MIDTHPFASPVVLGCLEAGGQNDTSEHSSTHTFSESRVPIPTLDLWPCLRAYYTYITILLSVKLTPARCLRVHFPPPFQITTSQWRLLVSETNIL